MWNYFNGDNDRNDTDDDEEDSLTNEHDPYELL